MRILLVSNSNNSLTQRISVELTELGHHVSLELALDEATMIEAVQLFGPELVIAPFLTKKLPAAVWRRYTSLIVHPGIVGDRGPSSLDWALLLGEREWGVTVLEAVEDFDAGPVWASETFRMPRRPTAKSTLYRQEVTEAAVRAVLVAVARFETGDRSARIVDPADPAVRGTVRPAMRQINRAIDWAQQTTEEIVRRVRASDSTPGVLHTIEGEEFFLFGAHEEDDRWFHRPRPGERVAQRDGAVCFSTVDGALWITHAKRKTGPLAGIKLPATHALGEIACNLPWSTVAFDSRSYMRSWREIRYEEKDQVGLVHFDFHGGAMGTEQCERLRRAWAHARSRPTKVIVLCGGRDFFSNGIHLNLIEAAADPAEESWRNINAIDDLVQDVLTTTSHLVIAAMAGNAGAGGAMLALAADVVFARNGVVLNPHYETMELSGSEYWTYTLPKRVGGAAAIDLTTSCNPLGTKAARRIGFIEDAFGATVDAFMAEVKSRAMAMATDAPYEVWLAAKRAKRAKDENLRPLETYRAEELTRMRRSFWGDRPEYHAARRRFVTKDPPRETPIRFALHRAAR